MKILGFKESPDRSPLRGRLTYDSDHHSFAFWHESESHLERLAGLEGTSSVIVGTLQIEFGVSTGTLLYVWGYFPRSAWRRVDLHAPVPQMSKCLKVRLDEEAIPGVSVSIARVGEWLTDFDAESGWIRIASRDSLPTDSYIEFAERQIAALRGDRLVALWLLPDYEWHLRVDSPNQRRGEANEGALRRNGVGTAEDLPYRCASLPSPYNVRLVRLRLNLVPDCDIYPFEIARVPSYDLGAMRTLPAPLLGAQKSASAVPYLKVVISDRHGGIRRLGWTRLYTGSEPDGYHAAAMPADGSLLRARVSGGQLLYQRLVTPGSGSNFSAWSDLGAAANAGVALCADGTRALLFYVDADGLTLRLRESTDSGATLATAATVAIASAAVSWLAADVKANGDALLLYAAGATVFSVKRTSGTWGLPAAWTNSAGSISGLACYHQGDWNVAVAGTNAAGDAYLWTCIFGDGFSQAINTWSALREVTRAAAASNVSFRAPFLAQVDTYRLTFVEKYTGSASYSRPYHSYSPSSADYAFNLWREPVPFDLASDFGQAIAFSTSAAWLSTPAGVWSAPLAVPTLDVTADVLEAAADEGPFAGRLRLVLRNDDGRYSTPSSPLKAGAEVRLSPGYITTSGAQVSDGPAYWIEGLERRSGRGEATLVIEARDAWGLLEAWRARNQHVWAAGEKNVFNILLFLFARAGLEFSSVAGSATSTGHFPAFTVHPGESGLVAVRRLIARLPDVIFVRGEFAYLIEPLASEATDYVYGGAGHPLFAGRYADEPADANRAQVFGNAVFGERFDWPGVQSTHDRLTQVVDRNLATVAQAETRADAVLRKAAIEATNGEITVPVNCGQELYDVIEVTDALAGLAAARRRVLGLSLRYSTGDRAVYEQRITLGGV